ncbi:MAG: protoporphyrinogen oxidase HemJ [Pseudomonadales bacterium]
MTTLYLWIKAFHIIAVVAWFAALFYMPRLFVYHVGTQDTPGRERFKIMEDKLYRVIMRPAMIATLVFGIGMLALSPGMLAAPWMWLKLLGVVALLGYHHYCARLVQAFAEDHSPHSERFYRMFNEAPTLLLFGIVILVVVKPF